MKISSELKYAIINLAKAAQDARYFNCLDLFEEYTNIKEKIKY